MLDEILLILADGDFHSGDELGSKLGVSRAAVWKRIKKVEELGLDISSVKGKGYRIDGGLDLLSKEDITGELDKQVVSCISRLDLHSTVASTNQLAMERAISGECGYVCLAEQQTAGRGRRGRTWVSPFAANIYLSVVWEFAGGAVALEGLSLAIGTAVVKALKALGLQGAELKWPNDVIVDDKKIAGILIEMVGDAAGPCLAVIGLGVNISMPKLAVGQIDQPYIDVNSLVDKPASRNLVVSVLLNHLIPLLKDFESKGFKAYKDEWLAAHAYQNQEVFLRLGDGVEYGVASGVDDNGAIVVKTSAGLKRFSGGEVSLRKAESLS